MRQERNAVSLRAQGIMAAIRIVLVLGASAMLSGCATAALWHDEGGRSTEKIVTRNSAVTAGFHSRSMDRVCFYFNNNSGKGGADQYLLKAAVDPLGLDYIRKNFSSPSIMTVLSVSTRLEPFPVVPSGSKWLLNVPADLTVSFEVPDEPGIVPARDGGWREKMTEPAVRPSADNPIVRAAAAKAINKRNVDAGNTRPLAWIDGNGAIIEDASLVEEVSCDQAIRQGHFLLIMTTDKDNPAYALVPAAVFCKYNCGILRSCSALSYVTITDLTTGKFNVNLPQAKFGPVDPADPGSGSCRGPDWTGLSLAPGKAVVSYDETVHERVPNLPLAVRIAATPVTVAIDVVTSPVQIIFFGVMLVAYKDLIYGMSRDRK